MKHFFLISLALILISMTGCAARKQPDTLEGAMQKQDKWLQKQVEKSKRRGESFDQKWDNYTKRQDEKYYAWRDKMLQD